MNASDMTQKYISVYFTVKTLQITVKALQSILPAAIMNSLAE